MSRLSLPVIDSVVTTGPLVAGVPVIYHAVQQQRANRSRNSVLSSVGRSRSAMRTVTLRDATKD